MLLVEGLARFSGLLDDRVAVAFLDDPLDARVCVSRNDREAVPTLDHLPVFGATKFDGLEARLVVALAVKAHGRGNAVELPAARDLVVDAAEDLLVAGCSLREVHRRLYHRRPGSNPNPPGLRPRRRERPMLEVLSPGWKNPGSRTRRGERGWPTSAPISPGGVPGSRVWRCRSVSGDSSHHTSTSPGGPTRRLASGSGCLAWRSSAPGSCERARSKARSTAASSPGSAGCSRQRYWPEERFSARRRSRSSSSGSPRLTGVRARVAPLAP